MSSQESQISFKTFERGGRGKDGFRVKGEITYHICFGDGLRREIGVLWRERGCPGTSDAALASSSRVRLGHKEMTIEKRIGGRGNFL